MYRLHPIQLNTLDKVLMGVIIGLLALTGAILAAFVGWQVLDTKLQQRAAQIPCERLNLELERCR